ncbi:MAG TPA: SDR family oxidoreductase [Streptosporangiaceae bacterium]
MDLGLDGKVALVAGGSSGLGLAVAKELASEGAQVAIGARDPGRLAAAQRALEKVARGRVSTTSVDVTDQMAARRWVDAVAADFGALHVVLVSGASPGAGAASRFAPADYRKALDTVLFPVLHLSHAALPHLKAAGWGRLLYVTSETAYASVASLAQSGVTRAAIVRYAQALAADVARDGITVNVLAPGPTRTEMVERAAARLADGGDLDDMLALMGSHNAMGRIGRPEEFAAVAAFLASERASFVTGLVHLIDGGASAKGPEQPYLATVGKDTFV